MAQLNLVQSLLMAVCTSCLNLRVLRGRRACISVSAWTWLVSSLVSGKVGGWCRPFDLGILGSVIVSFGGLRAQLWGGGWGGCPVFPVLVLIRSQVMEFPMLVWAFWSRKLYAFC